RPASAKVVLDRLEEILRRMPRPNSGPLAVAAQRWRAGRVVLGAGAATLAAGLALWVWANSPTTPVPGAGQGVVVAAAEVSEAQRGKPLASAEMDEPAIEPALRAPKAPTVGSKTSDEAPPVRSADEEIMADAAVGTGTSNGEQAAEAASTSASTARRSSPRRRASDTARCRTLRTTVENHLRGSRYAKAYESLDATCWSSRTSYYAIKARLLYELNQDEKCLRVGARSRAPSVEKWVGRCRMRAGK
ncbi:MAG: hypothetical protein ACPHRO_13630, partial [Nannocystaceae bacterium]